MSYCDTCGHKYSDVCGTCESLDGVPVQYSPKPSDVRPIKDDGIIGTFDYETGVFTPTRKIQKITNADIIRQMSDEELARMFCTNTQCSKCICESYCGHDGNGFLIWLKKEAPNGVVWLKQEEKT